MQLRMSVSSLSCVVAVLLASTVVFSQTITGQISGTVRDSQGGVLPGVTVTATNINTGIARTETTGVDGSYRFTNLPIGTYSVTAEIEGFRKAEKTGFELTADGRISADFALTVGGLTETVEVTAVRGETVNRTSGEIARTVDGDQVRELALSGRNFLELASLIPGAVQTEDDQMAITTGLGTGGTIINGARGNSNNLTVDGGFNLDSGSNGSMINNVGLDFIEQVKMQTSNFSAEYGRNSGASINVVTKSGTNRFRGSAFETFRDESLDAGNYFAPKDPVTGKKIKGRLDFNDYGASYGGPLLRNKLFFFAGLEFKSLDRTESPQRRTLPTLAELRGDFSARLSGADGIIGTADDSTVPDTLVDPTTGQPFPGGVIPPSRITTDGRAIARVYEKMIGRAALYSDTPTTNNATYQLDFPFDWRQEIVRIDYRHSRNHSFYFRYLHDSYDLIEPRGTFIGSDLPTISTNRIRPGFGYLLGHSWVLGDNLFNEVKLNVSGNGQRIPPYGDAWRRDTYGFTFPQAFDGGRYDEGIPDVAISGLASLTGPSASLLSPTTDITATNTLTWQKAAHSMRLGFLVTRNRKDQNGRLAHTGAVVFNTSTPLTAAGPGGTAAGRNPLTFADALLGNFRTYNEGADDPLGFFRFTQYGAFVSDTWRLRRNLSLEAGVRYELAPPIYTQGNNISNFVPELYDPAQAAILNRNGSILSPGTNRYTGLVRADSAIPEDQQNRVTIDERAAALIATGAPRGLYNSHHLFMPRFSLAYSMSERTVVRGGIGLFYDKPEGNTIFSQVNLPPWVPSISVENGNLSNPLGGQTAAASVLDTVNAIDPDLDIPKQLNFSVSVQRELRGGHFAEISYVGNRGRDLLWLPELNRVSLPELAANQALPSAQRAAENFLRPYKGYSSIRQRRSEMFANYNSVQFYLNRRKGDIKYSVSYTLSKAEGNASGNGDNTETGLTIQDALDTDFLVGPLSYDRRHALVTTWTYQMPFMRERRDLIGQVLGGWELSGKTRWQSGQYLTPTGQRNTGNRRADYLGGEISLPASERSEARWFNTDVFATAPDDRRGNAGVGMIEGPHVFTVDPSLRKNFNVVGRIKMKLRVDAFNVFNRVNFNNPAVRQDQAAFGTITAARPPRQMQFSLRLEF